MKQVIIKIDDYIFLLKINKDTGAIRSSHFSLDKNFKKDMTNNELKKGQGIQQKILERKYDYLIPEKSNVR